MTTLPASSSWREIVRHICPIKERRPMPTIINLVRLRFEVKRPNIMKAKQGQLVLSTKRKLANLVTPQAGRHGRPRVDIKMEASNVPIVPNIDKVTE